MCPSLLYLNLPIFPTPPSVYSDLPPQHQCNETCCFGVTRRAPNFSPSVTSKAGILSLKSSHLLSWFLQGMQSSTRRALCSECLLSDVPEMSACGLQLWSSAGSTHRTLKNVCLMDLAVSPAVRDSLSISSELYCSPNFSFYTRKGKFSWTKWCCICVFPSPCFLLQLPHLHCCP